MITKKNIIIYIALQQTRQDSLPQVKLGTTLNYRLFGVEIAVFCVSDTYTIRITNDTEKTYKTETLV